MFPPPLQQSAGGSFYMRERFDNCTTIPISPRRGWDNPAFGWFPGAYEQRVMRTFWREAIRPLLKTTVFNRYKNGAKWTGRKHLGRMFCRSPENQSTKDFKTIVFERWGFYIIKNDNSGLIWRFEKNCSILLKRLS